MKFLKGSFLILFAFAFHFVACGDDDEVTNLLNVDVEEILIKADKKTGVFTLETDASSWEIENLSDWLTLSATSGTSAKAMISVIVDGKTPEERSATLTIHAGNAAPVEVNVFQQSSEYVYSLEATQSNINLKISGSSASFEISLTAPDWSIENNADWLQIDKTSGSTDKETITVSADKNESGEDRNTKIIIIAMYAPSVEISISQGAAYPSYNTNFVDPDITGVEKNATELAAGMDIGWNIGNSLEVPNSETGWGNPRTSKALIDAVKAAGFNTVRIPCAWNSYADPKTAKIKDTWLARVKEVVDYCINNDLYVIINSHWDGGWLEEHPSYDKQEEVNLKQKAYWEQIATFFRDYDERLLFAGTNEVHAGYGDPSQENISVQESYNQTFVDAVRSTGGKNAYRNLIVQTYNTNILHGLNYFTAPKDVGIDFRLFVEVHYYDPYDFTLNESGGDTQWGEPFADGDVSDWGQEGHVDSQFAQLKSKFVDKGMPVILGEYGVIRRSGLTGEAYENHIAARNYFLEYVTRAALENGMVPVYWDNGHDGENGFALFNRSTGSVVDEGALNALMSASSPN
jgi:endoglucanase